MLMGDLKLSQTNRRILSYLVQNEHEEAEFREWHLGFNRSILFDIMAFRAVKVERALAKLSLSDFVQAFEKGNREEKREVLQQVFQQWVTDTDLDDLTERITNGLTLEALYEERRLKPSDFLHSLLRG